ncbi:MAG: glutamine-hydrolyzing GMP synthase [Gammaproteobacteria bacterium]|nr:glutamine-hydrolyzing GMP synthase [Gammaproteobacteria bacterium]
MIHQYRILIIDFGSQYAQLIARRVRECGVYCEIMHPSIADETIKKFNPSGIILSGGPETVVENNTLRAPNITFELNIPVLGVCYGMQTMAAQLGGVVEASTKREFGYAKTEIDLKNPLFQDISEKDINVWMSHGDHVTQIPPGFIVIAKTNNAPISAIANTEKQFYAVQFHPEVTHTQHGLKIIDNFLKKICHCEAQWTTNNIIAENIEKIRKEVGDEKVLLALSGGVDSSVLAALLHKAIGDQLICVFVDTGLMRKNEGDQVMRVFADNLGVQVIRVDAQDLFLKRKSIGKTFIDIFETESEKLQGIRFLAQGTIYPDVIESGKASSGTSHTIKSHHNVGGLPENMRFALIEPLRELFKDEVRTLGIQLGLPPSMVYRHPFPGVGLGIRILGEVKKDYIKILQDADDIFIAALREHHLYDEVSQAFAVFLPVKSVGVKGDARCYEYVIALRAVKTIDFMTAEWAELPHAFLAEVSNKILNEVAHVSRVVYDISGKPPSTIEWE